MNEQEQQRLPPWLPSLESYTPGEQIFADIELQTSILRGLKATETIDRYLRGVNPLSVLDVGLGYYQIPFVCPYEPYQISAYLQSEHVDYSLTLVDKNPLAIDDIRIRQQIFLTLSYYCEHPPFKNAWDLYLKRTQHASAVTHTLSRDTKLIPGISELEQKETEEELKVGLLTTDIPSSFREGLASGNFHTLLGPIEYLPIRKYAPYDFITCTNVLHLLNGDCQKLALANMSRSLASGKFMLINCRYGAIPSGYNPKRYTGAALFPEHGGWMTQDKLHDLRLKTVEQSPENKDGYMVI